MNQLKNLITSNIHFSFKNEDVLYRSNTLKKHLQIFWNLTSNLLIIASICKVIFEYFNYIFTFILNWHFAHFAQGRVLSFKKKFRDYNALYVQFTIKALSFKITIFIINCFDKLDPLSNLYTEYKNENKSFLKTVVLLLLWYNYYLLQHGIMHAPL